MSRLSRRGGQMLLPILVLAALGSACGRAEPEAPASGAPALPAEPTAAPAPTLIPMPAVLPVVVDLDMGFWDGMTLLYLLSDDDVDVRAITVSGAGKGYCQSGVGNAIGLLALVGEPDVPVACGRTEPLRGTNRWPIESRARTIQFRGLDLPEVDVEPEGSAVELLANTLMSSSSKVVLLTLGPLTNVGEALLQRPELSSYIDRVVIMGGAVRVPGNLFDASPAEWNIWIDPYAAEVVFQSGLPITLIPLDATNHVPVSIFTLEALSEHHATPAAQAAYELFNADDSLYNGMNYFWDPLAAVAMMDPSIVKFETMRLMVVQEGDEQGRTVEAEDGAEMQVAVEADAAAFEESFLSILNGGIPVDLPERTADIRVTYDGSNCTYEGPESVPAGRLVISVTNSSTMEFNLAVVTLAEGKGAADLLALPDAAKPPWAELVGLVEPPMGGSSVAAVELSEEPLYLVCLSPEEVLDAQMVTAEG